MRKIFLYVSIVALLLLPLPALAQVAISQSGASAESNSLAISGEGGDVWATMGMSLNQKFEGVKIPREMLEVPFIMPFSLPIIQGKVDDITKIMPKFAYKGLVPLNGEKVKEVKVFNGSIFDRIRLEDIEIDLINCYKKVVDAGWPADKIRYRVQYKDSAMAAGIGGGGNAVYSHLSGASGGIGSGLAVLPGYSRSTTDPQFIIKFYLVEL